MGVATAFPCQGHFFFATFPERFASRPRQTTKPFRKDLKNAANKTTEQNTDGSLTDLLQSTFPPFKFSSNFCLTHCNQQL